MSNGMTISLRGIAKGAEQGMPSMVARAPAALRIAADEIDRLRAAFRVNMLRLDPSISHAEIDALLDARDSAERDLTKMEAGK